MEQNKKAESARVVGYFCLGFALLMILGGLMFVSRAQSELGWGMLVVGLVLRVPHELLDSNRIY